MKFSSALISNVLLATSALAGLAQRQERRASRVRQSNPNFRLSGAAATQELELNPNKTNVDYSTNWAGAVLTAPPAGSTFTSVSATFTVPKPSGTTGAASAWVGIDGDTYSAAILQTGVDFTVTNGKVTYDCWYEWYPDYAYDFSTSSISISTGDSISLSIASTSSSKGSVVIKNLTTGKSVTKSLSAPSSSSHLGGQNAEWIVEDFEENGGLVPFANFGTVVFSGAKAGTSTGGTASLSGADILDIQQNGKTLTSVSTSGSSVTVSYV